MSGGKVYLYLTSCHEVRYRFYYSYTLPPDEVRYKIPYQLPRCKITGQECLTSTVGRGGIKHLTPWVKVLKFLPLAPSARGKEIRTFTRGVRYFIPPLPTVEVRYIPSEKHDED